MSCGSRRPSQAKLQEKQGVPAREGSGLVVLPRPNCLQSEKATSQDLLSKRWGGGGAARRGLGVPARGVLRLVRGRQAWGYHEPGAPDEPGPLVFSKTFYSRDLLECVLYSHPSLGYQMRKTSGIPAKIIP